MDNDVVREASRRRFSAMAAAFGSDGLAQEPSWTTSDLGRNSYYY